MNLRKLKRLKPRPLTGWPRLFREMADLSVPRIKQSLKVLSKHRPMPEPTETIVFRRMQPYQPK